MPSVTIMPIELGDLITRGATFTWFMITCVLILATRGK